MLIYVLIFAISAFLCVGISKDQKKMRLEGGKIVLGKNELKNRLFIFISGLAPFLVSALRYDIGTDYEYTYVPWFRDLDAGEEYFEVGFRIIGKIILFFTDNPQWLFVVTSFMFIYLVYFALYYLSENMWYSVILMFLGSVYFISMNNIRQSLSFAFALYGFRFRHTSKVKYIFFVILAASMHSTGWIYLIFLFSDLVRFKARILFLFDVIGLMLRNVLIPVINFIMSKIPNATFQNYFILETLQSYRSATVGRYTIILNSFIMFLLIILERHNSSIKETSESYNVLKISQFLVLGICIFDGIIPATYRLVRVFSGLQIVYLPAIMNAPCFSKYKNMLYVIVALMFLLDFVNRCMNGAEGVLPYTSII